MDLYVLAQIAQEFHVPHARIATSAPPMQAAAYAAPVSGSTRPDSWLRYAVQRQTTDCAVRHAAPGSPRGCATLLMGSTEAAAGCRRTRDRE